MEDVFKWKDDLNPKEWNDILSSMHGHPLQSAKWGDSRRIIDGINDTRWALFKGNEPVYLVRFEERRFLKIFKIAWVPKGPTLSNSDHDLKFRDDFLQRLRKKGFVICFTNPWMQIKDNNQISATHTIWIDLTIGKESIWNNSTKQFRYDVRRAKKMGVIVDNSKSKEDINLFYKLYESISNRKGFPLNGSAELISHLLKNNLSNSIESCLFNARYDGKFCGGALVIRCGDSVHYMWAAVDRAYSNLNIGELVQWTIIEWALSQNCKIYDLEGIDLKNNPGTYNFKKKLGGKVIPLPGKEIYILNKFLSASISFFKMNKLLNYFF